MPETPPAAVRARGLGKRFGRHWAVAHIDLEIAAGDSVVVAGSNGSGKTTLLRLVSGLLSPSEGELFVDGLDVATETLEVRRRLSLVSHRTYLYERLTALESLRMWARLSNHPHDETRLVALLEEVDLVDRRHSTVDTFSAGMRKRLALARSRIEAPSILLLDEPFAALDVPGQALVEAWVEKGRDRGQTVVVASHNLERAAQLCRTAILMRAGQQIWNGPAAELPRAFAKAHSK